MSENTLTLDSSESGPVAPAHALRWQTDDVSLDASYVHSDESFSAAVTIASRLSMLGHARFLLDDD